MNELKNREASKHIGWIFRTLPHSRACAREGLDALLATAAYSDDIKVFFIDDGVAQLLKGQQPEITFARNYIDSFKLLDLYGLSCYICQDSLLQFGRPYADLIIQPQLLSSAAITDKIHNCQHLLTF